MIQIPTKLLDDTQAVLMQLYVVEWVFMTTFDQKSLK